MDGEVVPAKKCPHYITKRYIAQSGQDERCRGCTAKPVSVPRPRNGNQHTRSLHTSPRQG